MTRSSLWRAALACSAAGCGPLFTLPDFDFNLPDAPPEHVHFAASVYDQQGSAVVGANVCVGANECGVTDDTGAMSVDFTEDTYIFAPEVAITGSGYVTSIYDNIDTSTADWSLVATLLTDDQAQSLLHDQAGFAFPSSSDGYVWISTRSNVAAPVIATLTGDAAGAGNATPVYVDGSGVPTPSLTSIDANGGSIFYSVPAGFWSLSVSGPGMTCQGPNSFEYDSGSATAYFEPVEVVAGAITIEPNI